MRIFKVNIFLLVILYSVTGLSSSLMCKAIFDNNLREIKVLMEKDQAFSSELTKGVFARVIRGKTEKDFETFTDDLSRNTVMVMDGNGLNSISGVSRNDILIKIGYTKDYINYLKEEGTSFKLVIFKDKEGLFSADWNGLGHTIKEMYPEHVYNLYTKHIENLKNKSFEDIDALGVISLKEAYENGPESAGYINSEKLTENSSLWEFRSFLYNEMRLTELYEGNGYTKNEKGEAGLAEYFFINRMLTELSSFEIIDL